MTGHVAGGASINKFTPGVRNTDVTDFAAAQRDLVQRDALAAAARVVVERLAGSDTPMVLDMLGMGA